jgi:hypothetical protein
MGEGSKVQGSPFRVTKANDALSSIFHNPPQLTAKVAHQIRIGAKNVTGNRFFG